MDKNRQFQLFLLVSVFIVATCGLIYELVAGALASYLLGDSVKQFSFIIGTYLFSMGVGAFFAKFIKKDLINRFIEIELLIGLVGGMSAVILFLLFQQAVHFQIFLYLFVFITGCLTGMEIPILMNILKNKVSFRNLVSDVFTFDYIGALIASILFPTLLLPKLGVMGTSLLFGLINILVGVSLCIYLHKEIKNPRQLHIKAFLSLAIILTAFYYSNDILKFTESNLYQSNVIYKHSTPYQRIILTEDQNNYQLYLNNNLQFNTKDEYRYHDLLVHPAMAAAPSISKVLILGGGDGLAAREILKYSNVQKIVLVDLDKGMTDLFKTNEILRKHNNNALNNKKVTVVNEDAFIWAKNNREQFDVIIIDFPDPSNYSLGKLYSSFFYKTLHQSMNKNTVVTVQSTSPYFAPKSFWCIHKTIEDTYANILPYHVYVPSFGEWGFSIFSQNPAIHLNKVNRKLDNLRFYKYDLNNYTDFPDDMKAQNLDINRLDNQALVRYFDEEWGKI